MSDNDDWLVVSVSIPAPALDYCEEAFWAAGADAISVLDDADDPVLEPAPGETPLWPACRVEAMFSPERIAPHTLLDGLRAQLPAATGWSVKQLANRPWERVWMDSFEPMRFGERLWIYPSHREPPPAGDEVVLRLDPGLAFGSGTHPTTGLCLTWLEQRDLHDRTVLDYGCGSGVLAIAALLLGAASAQAVDIDPQALQATRLNAERNAVGGRLAVRTADDPCTGSDVIVANILAQPLRQLAPALAGLHNPGGELALTGLLAPQRALIEDAYADWYEFRAPTPRDEWILLSAVRNRRAAP